MFESEPSRLGQLGIKRVRTTPYHPQTNGLTERNNHTLKEWLAAKGGNWETELPMILLAHRASNQGTTKKSSFQLMYGRRPRLPGNNIAWPQPQKWNDRKWKEERKQAVENIRRKQDMDVKRSEQHHGNQLRHFSVGDLVKCRGRRSITGSGLGSKKVLPKWEGPYTVIASRGPVYTIKKDNKEKRVNISQLQRWMCWNDGANTQKQPATAEARRSARIRAQQFNGGASVVDTTYKSSISSR
uniref:SJCHGC06920 protein n=1 Tax=Schistosoma japonicum TaxID=6182 RepID=Q5D9T2_SCHJA|nr:SJCHGC06920 protein [Schistosoma japonicum]